MSAPAPSIGVRVRGWAMNPWARAHFLWLIAIAYVVWTLMPVFIAVAFSFNAGKAQTTWRGSRSRGGTSTT